MRAYRSRKGFAKFPHDFITELENGYNTRVGERGDRLSGYSKKSFAKNDGAVWHIVSH